MAVADETKWLGNAGPQDPHRIIGAQIIQLLANLNRSTQEVEE